MKTIFKTIIVGISLCLSGQGFAAYTLPEYQKTTLDNGLTVYLMEQKEVPLIDATVVFNAGATRDGELAGLATMTIENMLFGAGALDKNAFEEALEFVGAEFTTEITLDDSRVAASFAKKDQQQILKLLADVIQAPQFDAAEFEKYKTRYLGALKRQKESPRNVIASYNNQLIYGEHPYSNPVGGDEAATEQAKLTDLKAFYHGWLRPENAALILVGDFDSAAMSKQVKQLFANWKGTGKTAKAVVFPAIEQFEKDRVLLVNKDDARETTFYIGGMGIPRSNDDFVALSVINTVLGGRFTSWLNDELRVNSGLTYGARSRFNAMKHSGNFYISTFTATENTEAAIDLALSTYARLWQKGLDDATLKSAKAYVKGLFPPRYETAGQLSGLLGDMFIYGFNESFINNFQSNVDKLDIESTKALIAKYFPQDNLQFTIIGKSADIKDIVKKYGEITEVNITAPGFEF